MNKKLMTSMVLTLAVVLMAAPTLAGSRIEREYELAPGGSFTLDTDVGSVVVRGTSGSGARLLITSRSEDLLSRFELEADESDGNLEISFEKQGSRMKSWMSWGRGESVKFEIELPSRTRVEIDTSGGSIIAENFDDEVGLDTSGGSISVKNIAADLNADTSGGSITVENVDGDVNADTSGGSIVIQQVTGSVRADTSGGSIVVEDADGDIDADTSGGSIAIENAGGYVKADTSGGSIAVSFRSGNDSGGDLSTSGGGVGVSLDPSVNLTIDAEASGGRVVTDIPLTVKGTISKSRVRGNLGSGGNTLKLRASGGKVRIEAL